jgi:hypothetical protein
MLKLSKSLKDLISLPAARPGLVPAPANVMRMFEGIAQNAAQHGIGKPSWLTISVWSIYAVSCILVLMIPGCSSIHDEFS